MVSVGALLFQEGGEPNAGFSTVVCVPIVVLGSGYAPYNIYLAGSTKSGRNANIRFVTIKNYNNKSSLAYTVDNVTGYVPPYTDAVVTINPFTSFFSITPTTATITLVFSEKELPIHAGQQFQLSSGGTYTVALTSGASFTLPANWNIANNKIHCIGAGAPGTLGAVAGRGGGGGGYGGKTNSLLAPSSVQLIQVGAGLDTTFSSSLYCKGAAAANNLGGISGNCVGDAVYSGGNASISYGAAAGVNGGGGAAGYNGAGQDGGNGTLNGGTGDGGLGGIGASVAGANGGNGIAYIRSNDSAAFGPGGGGASGTAGTPAGGNGGNYGAGGGGNNGLLAGGTGSPGVIILEWVAL